MKTRFPGKRNLEFQSRPTIKRDRYDTRLIILYDIFLPSSLPLKVSVKRRKRKEDKAFRAFRIPFVPSRR